MWESPIQMITDDIIKDLVQKQDEWLMEAVHRVGFDVDKAELAKALAYDRDQYEKGYADGRRARDSEIVRCRDCEHHREKPIGFVNCIYHLTTVDDDGFCKWGDRKETEDETSD